MPSRQGQRLRWRRISIGFTGVWAQASKMRITALIIGLAIVSLPLLARPAPGAHKAAQGTAAKKSGGQPAAAVASFYAAMPEAERLAIEADLAWIGDYEGPGGGDFDGRAIEAVKLFQKSNGHKDTGILSDPERVLLAAAAKAPQEAAGWRLIDDPATGARFGLPEKLVKPSGATRTGGRWASGRGQIQIETFRLREAALAALYDEEKTTPRGRRVDWSVLKPGSFNIAGMQGLKKFVVRAEANGTEVRGITVLYDQATEGIMAPVAIAMADTFAGFPDPQAAPLPGRKRSVEYGTAIAVDRRGDLLTLRQVTDECQAIAVPGLGHAERIAEDTTNDLALIRVNGAHHLVPAALAGGAGDGDNADLTLVGIVDPRVQQDTEAATRVGARRTAQGLDPAPAFGFSGAAALDGQGRFVGMVDLQWSAVAGGGPVAEQATLIPAETVRAFLAAHGITAAAGQAAMDQSIVRVICVRR